MLAHSPISIYLVCIFSLLFTYVFVVYKLYYRGLFAVESFSIQLLGIIVVSYVYQKIFTYPKYQFVRVAGILITFFLLYFGYERLTYFVTHGGRLRGGLTEFVELLTFFFTTLTSQFICFILWLLTRLSTSPSN
jgi:hypothetical protein